MPFADDSIGTDVVADLIDCIGRADPGNPLPALRRAPAAIAPLGLRQRCDLLTTALLDDLPGDAEHLEQVVRAALADDACTGWMLWPVSEAVAARAVDDDGTPAALVATLGVLADLTPRLTAEFAIRPLLRADLARALASCERGRPTRTSTCAGSPARAPGRCCRGRGGCPAILGRPATAADPRRAVPRRARVRAAVGGQPPQRPQPGGPGPRRRDRRRWLADHDADARGS